jgi:hypothetical protein
MTFSKTKKNNNTNLKRENYKSQFPVKDINERVVLQERRMNARVVVSIGTRFKKKLFLNETTFFRSSMTEYREKEEVVS